jgi:dihydroneopterin aldolase
MDKIILKDLEIYAYHGVAQEEKTLGQKFILTVELSLNLENAANHDDLQETVHYGILCNEIEQVFKEKKYDLIEAAAMAVIRQIFKSYPVVEGIKVLLKKPSAPIQQHLQYAAVELERRRGDYNGNR